MRPPYFINDVLFFKYLYSRNICKKQKLFLCLDFLNCGVWTANSGFKEEQENNRPKWT